MLEGIFYIIMNDEDIIAILKKGENPIFDKEVRD